jgi:hypothetical protein
LRDTAAGASGWGRELNPKFNREIHERSSSRAGKPFTAWNSSCLPAETRAALEKLLHGACSRSVRHPLRIFAAIQSAPGPPSQFLARSNGSVWTLAHSTGWKWNSSGAFESKQIEEGSIILPSIPIGVTAKAFEITLEPAGGTPQLSGTLIRAGAVGEDPKKF